jgi:hypothetical protein
VRVIRHFDGAVIQAVNAAREEALRLSDAWVTPEHLLLGLLHETEGLAARSVRALGLTQPQVRDAVGAISGDACDVVRLEVLMPSAATLDVLGVAARLKPRRVRADEVFEVLLGAGFVHAVFKRLGVRPVEVIDQLRRLRAKAGLDSADTDVTLALVRIASGDCMGFGCDDASQPLGLLLTHAAGLAARRGLGLVDTGCLLVACLQVADDGALASRALAASMGVDGLAVMGALLGQGSGSLLGAPVWGSDVVTVLRLARHLAHQQGYPAPGYDEVFAALILDAPPAVGLLLSKVGVSLASLRSHLSVGLTVEAIWA